MHSTITKMNNRLDETVLVLNPHVWGLHWAGTVIDVQQSYPQMSPTRFGNLIVKCDSRLKVLQPERRFDIYHEFKRRKKLKCLKVYFWSSRCPFHKICGT